MSLLVRPAPTDGKADIADRRAVGAQDKKKRSEST